MVSFYCDFLFWLKAIRASNPDLIGAQEVGDYAFEVIAHIGSDYQVRDDDDDDDDDSDDDEEEEDIEDF